MKINVATTSIRRRQNYVEKGLNLKFE